MIDIFYSKQNSGVRIADSMVKEMDDATDDDFKEEKSSDGVGDFFGLIGWF